MITNLHIPIYDIEKTIFCEELQTNNDGWIKATRTSPCSPRSPNLCNRSPPSLFKVLGSFWFKSHLNFSCPGHLERASFTSRQQWFSSPKSGSTSSAWPCWRCRRGRWGWWGSSPARWWGSPGRRCCWQSLPPSMSCRTTCWYWLSPTLMQAHTRYIGLPSIKSSTQQKIHLTHTT